MKLRITLATVGLVVCWAWTGFAQGAAQAPSSAPKIQVAVVTGGHGFDEAAFFTLFQGYDDIQYVALPQKDDSEVFQTIEPWPYKVIVLYSMTQKISEERRQNFLKLVDQGVGVVALHHDVAAFQDWPEFQKIIGTKFLLAPAASGQPASTWKDNVDFMIRIEDPHHPITRGLGEFLVRDEAYKGSLFEPDNHVLLTTDNADSDRTLGWVRKYRNANICTISLGHGPALFAEPTYRQLIAQAIRWAAGRLPDDPAQTFQQALQDIAGYEDGQSRAALYRVENLARGSLDAPAERAELERQMIEVVQSNATVACKGFLCRQLSLIATDKAVPALAAMLTDAQLSHLARYALERIPGPAADEALRAALAKTSGNVKAGVVNSLGDRRDPGSAKALAPLLRDADAGVAVAAAAALGKVGGPDAIAALGQARSVETAAVHQAVASAYLECADHLLSQGQKDQAAALFNEVYGAKEPRPIRAAAFRGLVLARGEGGVSLVTGALSSDQPDLEDMAFRLVREIPGKAATDQFAGLLPSLPEAKKVLLLAALADRGDRAAAPAAVAAAKDPSPAVRVAALQAVALLGDASAVPLLTQAASAGAGDEQKAAREALARLKGAEVDGAVTAAIDGANPAARIELIQSLAARQVSGSVPTLLKLAKDADAGVRMASIKALASLAGEKDMSALVGCLVAAQDAAERGELERTVVSAAQAIQGDRSAALLAALPKTSDAATRASVARVLGNIADLPCLHMIRTFLGDAAPEVQDAAVRALAAWPTTEPLPDLSALAEKAPNDTHRVLALRGLIRLVGQPSDRPQDETLKLYAQALKLAAHADEKKQALGALAELKTPGSLALVTPYLDEAEVKAEAAAAAVTTADAIADSHPQDAKAAMDKLLEACKDAKLQDQARLVLVKTRLAELHAQEVAHEGTASSPDNLDTHAGSGGESAAIDDNPDTYWDEVDNQGQYLFDVTFKEPKKISAITIRGYKDKDFAPRDFDIICDGKVVKSVKDAPYVENLVFVEFPPVTCQTIGLRITASYGGSPGIRELGVYSLKTDEK